MKQRVFSRTLARSHTVAHSHNRLLTGLKGFIQPAIVFMTLAFFGDVTKNRRIGLPSLLAVFIVMSKSSSLTA